MNEMIQNPQDPPAAPVRAPRRRAGAMERSVNEGLKALQVPAEGAFLATSAKLIARAIDGYAETAESAAQLSAIVKANVELRQTMTAVARLAAEQGQSVSAEGDAGALGMPQ